MGTDTLYILEYKMEPNRAVMVRVALLWAKLCHNKCGVGNDLSLSSDPIVDVIQNMCFQAEHDDNLSVLCLLQCLGLCLLVDANSSLLY